MKHVYRLKVGRHVEGKTTYQAKKNKAGPANNKIISEVDLVKVHGEAKFELIGPYKGKQKDKPKPEKVKDSGKSKPEKDEPEPKTEKDGDDDWE